MRNLSITELQHVTGGELTQEARKGPYAIPTPAISVAAATGLTAISFSPSYPEGVSVRLGRFDANFVAPRDSLGDELPLFPGLNDQGGVI